MCRSTSDQHQVNNSHNNNHMLNKEFFDLSLHLFGILRLVTRSLVQVTGIALMKKLDFRDFTGIFLQI
jgi:hypothetical protein